ncbi:olfactory receptor 1G1 [Salarias fasciatus]|uniref:olfactory receptor 1G1 n=1 Tax=Salarias fasciatus TaxID=181472 RepID=UPI001176E452|nr:olfactory receptor 1G1-like [Salarias fasciatus]
MDSCPSWDFSLSEKTFLAFFLLFLACVVFSVAANGFLFFLVARYRQLLWQPQYILLKNISACGAGTGFTAALALSVSVTQRKTQSYGSWCVAQFCVLRCFFLTSQVTLALMALERYVFICHGIHYLRVISGRNVHVCVGLAWLLSGAASVHGGLILSRAEGGSRRPTGGLLCDAVTVRQHLAFSVRDDVLVFGPPSVLTVLCILTICYCYACMYHAALKVSMALKCSNHRASRTVGLYILMFLLQLAFNVFFVVLTLSEKRDAASCGVHRSLVTALLIAVPPGIFASFFATRNPQINRLLRKLRGASAGGIRRIRQSSGSSAERTGKPTLHVEREGLNSSPPPLPGYIWTHSEDRQET